MLGRTEDKKSDPVVTSDHTRIEENKTMVTEVDPSILEKGLAGNQMGQANYTRKAYSVQAQL